MRRRYYLATDAGKRWVQPDGGLENGLDPHTVRTILRHLRSAAVAGTQVIITTHSPWLLDDVPSESIIQVRRVGGDTSS